MKWLLVLWACSNVQAPVVTLGMVAEPARSILKANWLATAENPRAPERLYVVTKDSVGTWYVGHGDSMRVLFVLEVQELTARVSDPSSFYPKVPDLTGRPFLHTHVGACTRTQWGIDYPSCSFERPDAYQCTPSVPDLRLQKGDGHRYDVIQCGPAQYSFYYRSL
jgi:hypothetical protein